MFKPVLENSDEIADFIVEFSTEYVDVELVVEYFFNCQAILKVVPLENLKEGCLNSNLRNIKKEKQYEMLPIGTMPPLVVENYKVLDGNHRLRVAKKHGIKEIIIYDILENETV